MMTTPKIHPLVGLLLLLSLTVTGQSLEEQFRSPDDRAKPKTWLHVMSGNMSAAGLTADLEAIERVGIGGVLIFNVTQGIPVGKVAFNSAEHTELMAHAARECERLGITFGMHNCDGWSSSGGPWNTPENSMKRVVWSDTVVTGGEVNTTLRQPPTERGFYRDIATLAWPALPAEIAAAGNKPTVTAALPDATLAFATDGKPETGWAVADRGGSPSELTFAYARPFTLRSVYLLTDGKLTWTLSTSDDGKTFSAPEPLRLRTTGKHEYAVGLGLAPVTARYFRLTTAGRGRLREARLGAVATLNDPLDRTAISRTTAGNFGSIGRPSPDEIVATDRMVDLTEHVVGGRLRATLPAGKWTVMRFGYTSTGAVNIPASAEGTGLEADKFDPRAFDIHYDAYVGKVVRAAREDAPNALKYVEIDSYEVGGQNWTHGLRDTFRREYDYDLLPFLPLFAGRFVDGATTSEEVLYDLRQLYARLLNDNYYGRYAERCRQDGLISYVEPYGNGPLNNLDAGGRADIPMGEFWLRRDHTPRFGDAVSSAHIYGKPLVAAEGFTAFHQNLNWAFHPGMAKPDGDRNWAAGINQFVFHRYAHQANVHVRPGMTMNRWGAHFDRTQTWWETAGAAYFRYVARGQSLLRQGVPVSDLAVFVGDGAPNAHLYRRDFTPELPNTLNYDCLNREVLLDRASVVDRHLVLPGGARYPILLLRNTERMSLATLRKLAELAAAGLLVVGEAPERLAGYAKREDLQRAFTALARQTWARPNVHTALDWTEMLTAVGLSADLSSPETSELAYTHRMTDSADIYFVHNRGAAAVRQLIFRNTEGTPELWDADNGTVAGLTRYRRTEGTTVIDLPLATGNSAFVVFRRGAATAPPLADRERTVAAIDGPWRIDFEAAGGYGGRVTTDRLFDWKDHSLDSLRYFAGTAAYRTDFTFDTGTVNAGERLYLDLGEVAVSAVVRLNDLAVDTLWTAPFTLDVTDAVRAGTNRLTVSVTNQWTNRLIGEERFPEHYDGYALERYHNGNNVTRRMPEWYTDNRPPPAGPRSTFSTASFYTENSELLPSGLLGPVRLLLRSPRSTAPASPPEGGG